MRELRLPVEHLTPPPSRRRPDTAEQALRRITRLKNSLKTREAATDSATVAALRAERSRRFCEQAELRELALAAARGSLTTVDEWQRTMGDKIINTRASLLGLPRRVAQNVEGKELAAVEAILREALTVAMGSLLKQEGSANGGEPTEANETGRIELH